MSVSKYNNFTLSKLEIRITFSCQHQTIQLIKTKGFFFKCISGYYGTCFPFCLSASPLSTDRSAFVYIKRSQNSPTETCLLFQQRLFCLNSRTRLQQVAVSSKAVFFFPPTRPPSPLLLLLSSFFCSDSHGKKKSLRFHSVRNEMSIKWIRPSKRLDADSGNDLIIFFCMQGI